jgi:hypothetical protein
MTTIQLTDEQRQALQAEQGGPVNVVDPFTCQRYVLLALEEYDRVRSILDQPPPAPGPALVIDPVLLRSMQAYWRELPELSRVRSKKKKWVAYHGDERIAFGMAQAELYQECFRRGLQRGKFYVGRLEIDAEGTPPWGTLEGDRSLYEADDEHSLPPVSE